MEFLRTGQPCITLSLAVIILAASGCATTGPAPGEQPVVKITSIDTRESDGKTEIFVGGDQPISQYTSFQLTEPLRLVVDLTDVDLGQFQDRMVVNKGPISDITPTQQDNIGRLEIALGQQVETKVYQDGGRLVVELGRQIAAAPKEPAPAPPALAPPPPAPEPEAPKGPAATAVTAVKATATPDGIVVSVTGNGALSPKVFPADKGMKLVVDIPGVRNAARPLVIPVRKGGLDKVRIGQHTTPEKKVRIVLDLTRPLDFTSATEGNRLNIALLAAAGAAPEQAPAEKAAPAPAPAPEREAAQAPVAPPAPPAQKERAAAPSEAPLAESVDMITETPRYTGRKISLDFQDADLVNILRLFAEMANFNMILSPDVRGKVTVRMVNVPWDQAMDIILKMNGLGYTKEDNILRIASLAALAREADDLAKAKEARKKAEDLITRIIPINYATAAGVEGTIKKSLSARGETVVDARTNTLIVKDIARNVDEVATLIRLLDKPIPQVMIEARIVQAATNFARDLGVQWGGTYEASAAFGNPTGWAFPNSIAVTGGPTMGTTASGSGNYLVNLPAAAGPGSGGAIGFTFGSLNGALNLDLVLSALESTGEGKVISSPRVSALDNKEAKIEQGQSIPYQSTSASGTQVQFVDAQLSLTVTPHITPDNKIFMKINATKNSPDTSLLGAGGQPSIRKNQATTEILLSDGETAVIGGILEIDRGQTTQKVPFLAELPLIGWLFKKKTVRDDKRELLIFITPRIIKQESVS